MTTFSKLKIEAAKVGATVEKTKIGLDTTVEVFSPKGFFWYEGTTHVLMDSVYTGPNDYPDLLSRMSYGLCKCEEEECEWCCE